MSDMHEWSDSLDNEFDADDWQHMQSADETNRLQAIVQALEASRVRPLTQDEAMLLAWASGVSKDFYKEIRK